MKKKLLFQQHEEFFSLCEQGYSVKELSRHFGVSLSHADALRRNYRSNGRNCFNQSSKGLTVKEKTRITLEIVQKVLSLSQASYKYNVPSSTLSKWKSLHKTVGLQGLRFYFEIQMKKQKQVDCPAPPKVYDDAYVKKLENELLKARAEVAFLKKLRALIQAEKGK